MMLLSSVPGNIAWNLLGFATIPLKANQLQKNANQLQIQDPCVNDEGHLRVKSQTYRVLSKLLVLLKYTTMFLFDGENLVVAADTGSRLECNDL